MTKTVEIEQSRFWWLSMLKLGYRAVARGHFGGRKKSSKLRSRWFLSYPAAKRHAIIWAQELGVGIVIHNWDRRPIEVGIGND